MGSTVSKEAPLVSVNNVSFNFGTTKVLLDVTFSMSSGDFVAIIGPNGSGKTTLLRIIIGIIRPSKGFVQLLGEDIETFSQWEKVGYVPQKATNIDSLFPVSVKEVVAMGLLSSKKFPRFIRKRDEEAIDRALEHVNLQDFRNRRIGELSGGQQQRGFIARAIVNRPVVLFLDEPTTGADAETQERQ